MTDTDAAFENLKKEIRSVLLPFKEGCTLFMFRKEYKTLIGRAIPAEKFGFRDDVDLLQNIPDVVETYQRGNECILMAVADEATWHIQKMVAHQKKPSKGKSSRSVRTYSRSSRVVPRSSYAESRRSSHASMPRYASTASNTQSSGSWQPPAGNQNFSWTHTGTSNQSCVLSSTSAVSNGPVSNGQYSANRSSTIGSNGQLSVNRPTTIGANAAPLTSSNPTSTNNTTSAVSNHIPIAPKQSAAASNPSHFVSNSFPAQATQVVGNKSVSCNTFSRQFKQDLPPRFRARSTTSSTSLLPPEIECKIVDVVRKYSTGLRMRDFFSAYQRNFNEEFSLEKHSFSTLQECLETIADLSLQPSTNNDFIILYEGHRATQRLQKTNQPSGAIDAGKSLQSIDSCGGPTTSFKKDMTAQVFKFNGAWGNTSSSGTQAQGHSHYMNQNQPPFNPNLEPASFNFQEQSHAYENPKYYNDLAVPKPSPSEKSISHKRRADALDNFELNDLKVSSLGLTEQMKCKFREIISRNKQGIQAKEFPLVYESVTGSQFDLHTLGFTDLAVLVDSMPDIMHRRKVEGSRKDWLIIPAHGYQDPEHNIVEGHPQKAALQIECCIQNTRMILEAYSEGIPLNEFLSVYSINCNEPLYIVDLGFDNIENFLKSISERVPLVIRVERGAKIIFLDNVKVEAMNNEAELAIQEVLPESIPFDAASPDCEYKKLVLPLDIGTSNFIAVYTSEIISPEHIFIQLVGKETSEALNKLSNELEEFYNGPNSDYYMVQDRHLKVGAMCASQWPKDQFWYRARIVSVKTPDIVRVFYVDYGTSDDVPIDILRYLKESFSKLPAQAIRASLAHLIPPNKALVWSPEAKRRMLELCRDVLLMAKVEHRKDDVLHLLLCDTSNGDTYINDSLINEGFAVSAYAPEDPEPPPPQQLQMPMINAETIERYLYNAMTKAMTDLVVNNYPGPLSNASASCQSSLGSGAGHSAFGVMPNQMPAGIAAGLSISGVTNNQPIPGSSAYLSPSRFGAAQPSLQAIANQHPLLGAMNYQQFPESYQSPSGIGSAQPSFGAMTNHLPAGISARQSTLGTASNQQFPGSYQSPSGFSRGQPSLGTSPDNMPPGFSAFQSYAGFNASQLSAGAVTNQFPPGFGPYQPSAGVTSGYDPQPSNQSIGSTDNESEFFEDGDDEFDEFLEKSSSVSKRYVKRIDTDDGYIFHILIVDRQLYVSSGDISSLIWCQNEPDYLLTMLQSNDKIFESLSISEEGNDTMFAQFEQFHVKGIQKEDETACLIIYPLQSTMKILNEYGHPSVYLRQHIVNEMASFNPNLPAWQELSNYEIPDPNETVPALSDEEKDNRRCLYELKLAKEGIRVRMDQLRRIMVADPSKAQACQEEMTKHHNLNQRVELRIAQIQKVCSEFSKADIFGEHFIS